MLVKKLFSKLIYLPLIFSCQAMAENYKPDDHAPIGVMRDHVHKQGDFMTSFRTKAMVMKGLRNGDDKVKTGDALDDYMMVPTEMMMRMHMVGVMYGVTDNFTISTMAGMVKKDMDSVNRMAVKSNSDSSGFSDTKINASYQFLENNQSRSQFNFGISLPTGSINKKSKGERLAYVMQIGSGSYEINPGISYSSYQDSFSYGGQINLNFKLNKNSNDYKLGDRYNLTAWIAKNLNESFSISSRLDYNKSEAIEGKDLNLTKNMPSVNPGLYNRESLDLLFGINYLLPKDILEGNRLALEFGLPIYQRIDGPMLENNFQLTFGWQKVF